MTVRAVSYSKTSRKLNIHETGFAEETEGQKIYLKRPQFFHLINKGYMGQDGKQITRILT